MSSFEDLVLKSADRVVSRHHNVLEIRKGGKWDPGKHPRDNHGRFIERGGIARVTLSGGTSVEAKVDKINDDGSVDLKIGNQTIRRQSGEIEMLAGRGGKELKEPDPPRPKGKARTELKQLQRGLTNTQHSAEGRQSDNEPLVASLQNVIDGKPSQADANQIVTLVNGLDEKSDDLTEFAAELDQFGRGDQASRDGGTGMSEANTGGGGGGNSPASIAGLGNKKLEDQGQKIEQAQAAVGADGTADADVNTALTALGTAQVPDDVKQSLAEAVKAGAYADAEQMAKEHQDDPAIADFIKFLQPLIERQAAGKSKSLKFDINLDRLDEMLTQHLPGLTSQR